MEERFSVAAHRIGCSVEITLTNGRVTRAHLSHTPASSEPPLSAAAQRVHALLVEHFETGRADFAQIDVSLDALPPFYQTVLKTLHARVPAGDILSYAQLAVLAGRPGASRAVGGAMHANPIPVIVPCHRVVASGGKLGEYSGVGSTTTKRRLLELEKAPGFSRPETAPETARWF